MPRDPAQPRGAWVLLSVKSHFSRFFCKKLHNILTSRTALANERFYNAKVAEMADWDPAKQR